MGRLGWQSVLGSGGLSGYSGPPLLWTGLALSLGSAVKSASGVVSGSYIGYHGSVPRG